MDSAGVEIADYRIAIVAGREVEDNVMTEGDLSWRDYFAGARAHCGLKGRSSVHIAKVYRSRTDGLYKLVISAPIVDGNGAFRGVICTAVTTDATLGLVNLEDAHRKVVLIAPEDKESPDQRQSGNAVILFHPSYQRRVAPAPTTTRCSRQRNRSMRKN